ncbi:MAG TPA: hypothetical protein VN789_11230, partial [Casimicrobiaceae bacterium]|nr:hypothetical protein [Casimicrobiaceae bacterium]
MGVTNHWISASTRWLLAAVAALILALVFLWWSIQTAWLGSFPGRNIVDYSILAYLQLAVGIGSFIFAIYSFVRVGR